MYFLEIGEWNKAALSGATTTPSCVMSGGEGQFRREETFQRLLETVAARVVMRERIGAGAGEIRLWPRCAETPQTSISGASAVVAAYAAHAVAPANPEPPALAPEFARIREELRADLRVEELRRLRRRCALLAHPDRTLADDRALAEDFLAEINAAIDRAIKNKSGVGRP